MVFVFGSVYVVNYIYRLVYVEPALHPQDEAYLIMVDTFFDVLLDSVCQYFTEDYCINVHHGYWPVVFFFSYVSARFWYQDDDGLIERGIPSFCISWNSFNRNGTSNSLYCW